MWLFGQKVTDAPEPLKRCHLFCPYVFFHSFLLVSFCFSLFFSVFFFCGTQDDRTALFFACEHCHKPVAAFLVGQNGVDVNAKDGPSGHSPLHRACIAGQTREKVNHAAIPYARFCAYEGMLSPSVVLVCRSCIYIYI